MGPGKHLIRNPIKRLPLEVIDRWTLDWCGWPPEERPDGSVHDYLNRGYITYSQCCGKVSRRRTGSKACKCEPRLVCDLRTGRPIRGNR